MNRKTKYVGVLAQLTFALSGCGAGVDTTTSEADREVGSVAEALTTQDQVLNAGEGFRLDWDGVTMFMSTVPPNVHPASTYGWSARLYLINKNAATLHVRKAQVDLTCSTQPNGAGATTGTEFVFSANVVPNGGTFERLMLCPYAFGYPYLVKVKTHTETSFG